MTRPAAFPARSVVVSFLACEEALARILRIVPWCDQHANVWSPMRTTVNMEASSQIDSLWGYTAWLSPRVRAEKKKRRDMTIEDHFRYSSNRSLTPIGERWVVFWGAHPTRIQPFEPWAGANTYKPLKWWTAYNSLKHDRLANQELATLSAAVSATAGLFLAILECEHCRYAVEAAGWLTARESVAHNPKASLGEDSPSTKDSYVLAETALFSYPVGWCKAEVKKTDDWRGNASFRFKHWFWEYATT